jgi:predicted acetyltransferase
MLAERTRNFWDPFGSPLVQFGVVISLEDLRSSDEEDAYRLAQQAFGGSDPYDPERPGVGAGRHVAAYLDGTLVAQVRRHAFGQYFGGRRLACAGISGVTVAPQARNRNLARRLLMTSLDRAAADGEAVAALYPTTAALYRSVGFEVAGWWMQRGVALQELPQDDGSVTWERADFDDARAVTVYDQMAPDHDGWLDPGPDFWTWRAIQARKDDKANRYLYIGLRDGEPVAAVQYAYGASERAMYRIDVEAITGIDGAALRSALAFLGANGTTADEVRTVLPVDELELHLAHVQRTTVHQTWPWMLALVDLPRAIGARGYPPGLSGSVPLVVDDAHRPGNSGKWVLSVADGEASLEPGGDGHIEVSITDLAAVFTGHLDPLRLARAGRLGDPTSTEIGLLRAAFAGQPSLTIFF